MDDKEKMTKKMLDAINMFCQKFTKPEFVAKHLSSTVAATIPEVEKMESSSQKPHFNLEIQNPTSQFPKHLRAMDSHNSVEQFTEIPNAIDLHIICHPNIGDSLPNIPDINMSDVEAPTATGTDDKPISNQFANMETIDVVRSILGVDVFAPKPY